MDADNARAAACPPLRLLVADDQPIIRRGLALMLGAEDDIEVVGQAADGQQALELAHALHPDVVVMDLHMPRVGGVAATPVSLMRSLVPITHSDSRVEAAVAAMASSWAMLAQVSIIAHSCIAGGAEESAC